MLYVSLVERREIGPERLAPEFGGERPGKRTSEEEHPSIFCPACSTRLEAHRCKLRCPKCGYYMSCSDYY